MGGNEERTGEMGNQYSIFMRNPEGKRKFGILRHR
jgi:hypothetical protein